MYCNNLGNTMNCLVSASFSGGERLNLSKVKQTFLQQGCLNGKMEERSYIQERIKRKLGWVLAMSLNKSESSFIQFLFSTQKSVLMETIMKN